MNDLKIGVIIDSFRKNFNDGVLAAREVGAEGIQVYAVGNEMDPEKLTGEMIREKLKIVKDNGLEVSAICGDLGGHGFEISSDNPLKIERSVRIMELALKMETKVVTTHIGVIPSDTSCERYSVMQDACRMLGEAAASAGGYFAIETGPETAVVLRQFLDSLGTKGVAVNLDPANLVMVTGDDPVKAVETLGPYIVHTHAKDGRQLKKSDPRKIYGFFADGGIEDIRIWEYFEETPLGKGDVDFTAYVDALRKIGYRGYLTIERETGEEPAADIRTAVDFLKRTIK